MNRKPTPAQRRVLEALADGAVIRRGVSIWVVPKGPWWEVHWRTAEVLRINGWLNWPDRGKDHTITPAGLAAIGRAPE